jgi:hypothetical protein
MTKWIEPVRPPLGSRLFDKWQLVQDDLTKEQSHYPRAGWQWNINKDG